jgi:hypothetical protein
MHFKSSDFPVSDGKRTSSESSPIFVPRLLHQSLATSYMVQSADVELDKSNWLLKHLINKRMIFPI